VNDRSHHGISPKSQQFPRLVEFCQGYLHQDFLEEYGSVESAASTYLADTNPNQVRQLKSEWDNFLAVVREHASTPSTQLSSFRKAMIEFGASWRPQTLADIDTLTKIFAIRGK
jgi:hypothetical protein